VAADEDLERAEHLIGLLRTCDGPMDSWRYLEDCWRWAMELAMMYYMDPEGFAPLGEGV